MNYHIGRNGQQLGSHPLETVQAKLASGEFKPDDLGWTQGMGEWRPLSEIIPAPAMPPLVVGSMPPPAPLTSEAPPPKPKNNLVPSILVTLFCCLPFGIAAIVYAARVDGKYSGGDYAGAERDAASSRKWMWWSFGLGLAFQAIYVGMVVVGFLGTASSSGFQP